MKKKKATSVLVQSLVLCWERKYCKGLSCDWRLGPYMFCPLPALMQPAGDFGPWRIPLSRSWNCQYDGQNVLIQKSTSAMKTDPKGRCTHLDGNISKGNRSFPTPTALTFTFTCRDLQYHVPVMVFGSCLEGTGVLKSDQ
jgi:hypothetical protein